MGWMNRLNLNDNIGSVALQIESLMGQEVSSVVHDNLCKIADRAVNNVHSPSIAFVRSVLVGFKYSRSNRGYEEEFSLADCLLNAGRRARFGKNTGVLLYCLVAEEIDLPLEVIGQDGDYVLRSGDECTDLDGDSVVCSGEVVGRHRLLSNHVVDLAGYLFSNQYLKDDFDCYELAVSLDPLNFLALHRLSASCRTIGDIGAGLYWVERALKVCPDDVDSLKLKAEYRRLLEGNRN